MELRDNMLKTLPSSMSSLAKLRVLDLGSNLLEDLVSVPALLADRVITGLIPCGRLSWLPIRF